MADEENLDVGAWCFYRAAIIPTPQAASNSPAILPIHSPFGETFSTRTRIAISATHHIFITPATNNNAIRNQQHPAQYAPCFRPMRNAPPLPSRQSFIKKVSGERQFARQVFFMGVHWKTPAAMSNIPPSRGLVLTIAGESKAVA